MEWFARLTPRQTAMLAVSAFLLFFCLLRLRQYQKAEWKYAAKRKLKDALFLFVLSLLAAASLFWIREELPGSLTQIPVYEGEPSVIINDDVPFFSEAEKEADVYESYGEQDWLGRCTAAQAMLGRELLPDEERGAIDEITPSGWQSVRYDDLIEDSYLYHRCHLIAFQLSGQNANARNLITGTQYMNIEGMRPIENQVSAYIHRTGNQVLYRVTPVYEGNELVARGVLIEAESIEDGGEGILLNRYCFNVQPGIIIDYGSGSSRRE